MMAAGELVVALLLNDKACVLFVASEKNAMGLETCTLAIIGNE
jgi:hypothetical protein